MSDTEAGGRAAGGPLADAQACLASRPLRMHSHRNGRGYRREVRRWEVWHTDAPDAKGAYAAGGPPGPPEPPAGAGRGHAGGERPAEQAPGGAAPTGLADLEKRLSGVQHDFTQALQKSGEKENEKFDLIFAILVELQGRQAQLEESVRLLTAQFGGAGGQPSGGATGPAGMSQSQSGQQSPHGQYNGNSNGHQSFGQMNGQMNGQLNGQLNGQMSVQMSGHMNEMNGQMNGQMSGHMNGQQAMQQFSGVMQPDTSQAMFTAVPQQIVVVASPSAGGMQYMPQMMSPTGAMQPMPMQYMGQGAELGGFVGSGAGIGNGAPCAEHQQQQQPHQPPQPQPPSPQSPHLDAHVTAGDSQAQLPPPQQRAESPLQQQAQPPPSPSATVQSLQPQHDGTSDGSNAMAGCLQHGVVIQQPQQVDHGSTQPASSSE